MRRSLSRWRRLDGVWVAAALAIGASGAEVRAGEGDESWHLDLNVGLWATSATGETGIGPLTPDVNVDFSDLVRELNFAAMGGLELTKGDWLIAFNGMYARLENSTSGPRGRGDIDVTADMGIADLALGYTLVHTRVGSMPLRLTPVVGVRYTYLSLELDPERRPKRSDNTDWWDPYVGGQVVLGLTRTLDWRTAATIGGFGVGSDFAWSAETYLDWEFAKDWTLNVGYRALSWDYDQNNFTWDMTIYGPWIGLTVRLF